MMSFTTLTSLKLLKNSVIGIRKRVFLLSKGSSEVKLSAGTAARPSALPRNPIIPPIIAVTLSWPFLFPAVTHKLGISLISFTAKSPTASLQNISLPHPCLIADLDKSEPLFSTRHACHPPTRLGRKQQNPARRGHPWTFSLISVDRSGSGATADSLMAKCADSGRVLVPSGLQQARSGWATWKNCNTTQSSSTNLKMYLALFHPL